MGRLGDIQIIVQPSVTFFLHVPFFRPSKGGFLNLLQTSERIIVVGTFTKNNGSVCYIEKSTIAEVELTLPKAITDPTPEEPTPSLIPNPTPMYTDTYTYTNAHTHADAYAGTASNNDAGSNRNIEPDTGW